MAGTDAPIKPCAGRSNGLALSLRRRPAGCQNLRKLGTIVGRQIPFRGLPAVINLGNASVTPIAGPFLEEPYFKVSVGIVAVQSGPFERVINTNDTCLNVRSEPLPSAGILECAAEGVLLRDLGDATEFAGSTWLHIATPGGAEGWANAQYLER